MNNIKISKMTISDFYSIKPILLNEFDDFWKPTILENELNADNSFYIIATIDNKIMGFAGFKVILDEANMMNIVTKKSKRNLGIGTLLIKELIKLATSKDLTSITLEVDENNLVAINLYKKFNFKIVGTRTNYYHNGNNAILMTLLLK